MIAKGQQYLISEDVVQPGHVTEYEAVMRELARDLQAGGFQVPLAVTQTSEHTYYVVSPINSLDEIDIIGSSFASLAEKMGADNYMHKMARLFATLRYQNHSVGYHHARLSYWPQGQDVFGAQPYVQWQTCYIYPNQNETALSTVAEMRALLQQHQAPCHHNIYTRTLGDEMPVFTLVMHAHDPVDHHQRQEQALRLMGNAWRTLQTRLDKTLRRVQASSGYQRLDLSYTPE